MRCVAVAPASGQSGPAPMMAAMVPIDRWSFVSDQLTDARGARLDQLAMEEMVVSDADPR
ncbi:hypothetical protein IVA80_21835 [Bradyrhizobium sp. 139]|uniref:hypothetical protein n=1 Tax=Bradyrhizobium sp. 139 TaxID=2782616 RepID=UPI001FF7AE51|nr:hypothetical protein [Bradyrhizobium sp. 139]MCK1743423.1 hypothetical protein [Bradyrhizobium sp. 139]